VPVRGQVARTPKKPRISSHQTRKRQNRRHVTEKVPYILFLSVPRRMALRQTFFTSVIVTRTQVNGAKLRGKPGHRQVSIDGNKITPPMLHRPLRIRHLRAILRDFLIRGICEVSANSVRASMTFWLRENAGHSTIFAAPFDRHPPHFSTGLYKLAVSSFNDWATATYKIAVEDVFRNGTFEGSADREDCVALPNSYSDKAKEIAQRLFRKRQPPRNKEHRLPCSV
jgi:hypothetical protein